MKISEVFSEGQITPKVVYGIFEVNCPSVFSVIENLTLSNTCKNINNHIIFAVLVKFSLVDANMPVF